MSKTSVLAAAAGLPKLTTDLHPEEMPPIYCMQTMGVCMEPVYPEGCKLLFSSSEPYRYGDDVAVFLRPECVRPGEHQIIVKRLVVAPRHGFWRRDYISNGNIAPTIIVEMLNPRKMLYIEPANVMGVHKCLGLVPEGHRTFKVSDDWVRQQAASRATEEAL